MLTSSANQYLRPEYLTPLPTTLDAKKSPLALLAQTCSQIGADPPTTSKSLHSSAEKSSNKSSKSADRLDTRDKSSPNNIINVSSINESKPNSKPSSESHEKSSSPEEQRAPSSNSTQGRSRTPSSKRCSSNQSASSRAITPQGRKTSTPNGTSEVTRESPLSRTSSEVSSQMHQSLQLDSKSPYTSNLLLDPSMKDLPLSVFKSTPTAVSTSSYLSYPLPIDVMTSSLMSLHHVPTLKNVNTLNPYLNYSRIKGTSAGGATDSPLVCRDPYCTGCQYSSHLLNPMTSATAPTTSYSKLSTTTATTSAGITNVNGIIHGSCPAGCIQCDHNKTAPTNPYGSVMSAHNSAMAAYAHAQLAALAAASQLPYVCNWIAGDTTYCGKRFSSSEELLQHLRSHTSVTSDPGLSFLTPTGLPPGHPLYSRNYPTPPLSPLATARYHPYGKTPGLLPSSLSSFGLTTMPPAPHPAAAAAAAAAASLPPYLSPYSFFGPAPRLGATSGLHH
ncbi:zinc finger protein Elbow [Microplitis demolitor]|uniref:zinc finger protein Elbow n=1 Tax=Microplitis demolitor TaxID=69319 RepID=UPI0004CCC66C|nr:zinc finger protein Elbow [Microplitis demolitor]